MKPEQITAWALDEASTEDRQQLEATLLENPQDKQKADETKAFCDFLLSELRDDSLALTDKQRERLVAQASQPAAQSSRLPEVGSKSTPQTRWNIGVIVRLSLAACAVLGGFWTWQAYTSKQSQARTVAAVAEKPGIKVQLPSKPDAKKKAGQGQEARLLAATPAKPALMAELPAAKPLSPMPKSEPAAAVSALTVNKEQRAMTLGDVERLKRIQDESAYGLSFDGKLTAAGAVAAAKPLEGFTLPTTGGLVEAGTGMQTLNDPSMLVGSGALLLNGATVTTKSGTLATAALAGISEIGSPMVTPAKPSGIKIVGDTTAASRSEPTLAFGNTSVQLGYIAPSGTTGAGTTLATANGGSFGTNSLTVGSVVSETPMSRTAPVVLISGGIANYMAANRFIVGDTFNNSAASPAPAQSGTTTFASAVAATPRGNETAGAIAGSGAIAKSGAGTLVLSGANSYSGTTTVNGGSLQVSSGAAMPFGDEFVPPGEVIAGAKMQMKRSAGATLNISGGIVASTAPAAQPMAAVGGREFATFNSTPPGVPGPQAAAPIAAGANTSAATATSTPQAGDVAKVQSGLLLANGAAETGNYDAAITQYQNVLRTDPYNAAARRGMENAEQKRQAYFKTAYDNQRSKMLAQISETWENKVPVPVQSGQVVLGKDVKTDDFYLSTNAMPAEGKESRKSDPTSGETYTRILENELKDVAREPLSTLSIDVDTASYANVRRFLNQNMIPPPDAVRIEELVNYFPTAEEGPAHDAKEPFSVRVELAPCPWQPVHRLARIAIKGREMDKNRKASNLVFLVDVSGSMNEPAKLPLVQQSLRMLTEQLGEGDRVTMVVYAGSSGVVLPPTSGEKKEDILAAINRLSAGGSTHGSAGIKLAYEQAVAGFIKGGVNRVILCTDGDFNVGVSSPEELEKLIKHKAKTGVFLSVLGFGSGNLQDRTMETLADKGNGNYAYIDSLSEARKVLVEQMSGTLVTIAKDVKIQVEFNPAAVRSYRLIGYENRLLAKEDFNDDTKDAGEIGAGHSVVALYEIVPANLPPGAEPRPLVDDLKYQAPAISSAQLAAAAKTGEMMTVKLRYKEPESDLSKLIEVPTKDEGKTLTASSDEFKFSAAVAGFGLLLRDSSYKGTLSWETVRRLALDGKGADKQGYRGEFLQLIDKARGLKETRP